MKYLFLITMKVSGYNLFIELGKEYELNIHPNITDQIWVDDCFCSITEILHNIDNYSIWLKLEMYDPQHVVESSEEAVERLISDIDEFKSYGWYLNDYDLDGWRPTM